ncbi:glycosyltransferase family 10 domain-containing protein [Pseudooceanicola algae]|uniref:Fucosyltransferase C-terminal domain-containing protein n=1 Tax=Pseudooceanicola algae TaxID=1537215 RepID=A0A418SI33_9RHOB|nr:glycosyltransferase family 10 [Pseudooceanicola algae]QPM92138.1 hypothetical protein PSAL_034010 [Pseudooceanicola algae]
MQNPAIAIAPYGTRLTGRYDRQPCDDLIWPLGQPDRLRGATLGEMTAGDHLILYPRNEFHLRPFHRLRAQISLMVQEPRVIHGHHRRWLRLSARKFFRVISHDRGLVDGLANGIFVPFGTTWVSDWKTRDLTKTGMSSLIASAKRSQEGHRLRHEVVDWAAGQGIDLQAMGGGYAPFDQKADGLAPYRYSVVIENAREPDYFSEKLVDAMLCLTVPIYWGCPNIADYIPTGGMVICDDINDIQTALRGMSVADYGARLPALMAARPEVARWTDLELRTAEALRDSL